MKIRIDYVSNSSSSSYIIFGGKVSIAKGEVFSIDRFDELSEDEAFIMVVPNLGNEGDYIFPLTPAMLMDCDLHGIRLRNCKNLKILKAKYVMSNDGYLIHNGKNAAEKLMNENDVFASWDDDDDSCNLLPTSRDKGLALGKDIKMFSFEKDNSNPSSVAEIMETLAYVMGKPKKENDT